MRVRVCVCARVRARVQCEGVEISGATARAATAFLQVSYGVGSMV